MLALISDIHGNFTALTQVMDELRSRNVQQILCLGDVAATGPQPGECLELLAAHHVPAVLGNADEWLLSPSLHAEVGTFQRQVEETDLWCAEQLSAAHWAYIRSFQYTLRFDAPTSLLCFHGTPRSNLEIIEATTPQATMLEIFEQYPEIVLAGGHTHQQMLRRIQDRIVLNPGSVGLAYEVKRNGEAHNVPWAEYALIKGQNNALQIEFCRVPVDVHTLRQSIRQSGMPYAEAWAAAW
jgi:predicted phosphodiesterase